MLAVRVVWWSVIAAAPRAVAGRRDPGLGRRWSDAALDHAVGHALGQLGAADDVRVKRTPDWPGALEGSWRWLSPLASVPVWPRRSEEHTSELQSRLHLVCRLLLEKKNT